MIRKVARYFTLAAGLAASLAAYDVVAIRLSRWLQAQWGLNHYVEAVFLGMVAGALVALPFWWALWRLFRRSPNQAQKGTPA